jgi:GNAT superfamily N-acetyltransferase
VSEIRALLPPDDRGRFSSGDPDLDRFFRQYAGQNQFRHHIGVTYVAVDRGTILGYATVAASHIEVEELPETGRKRLPRYPLPVLRLGRLAVDASAQGKGIGKMLLRHVFALAHGMAGSIGCVGVVVDAKEGAAAFYRKLGFERLETVEGDAATHPPTITMFLPLGGIPKP